MVATRCVTRYGEPRSISSHALSPLDSEWHIDVLTELQFAAVVSSPSTHLLAAQLPFHVLLITAATGESLLAATTGGM